MKKLFSIATTSLLAITLSTYSVESIVNVSPVSAQASSYEYKNALYQAQNYSDSMHLSKRGLYKQLTSSYGEGFSASAAKYAINNVNANWNKNALAKAKEYQRQMKMSSSAIKNQLMSSYGENFTASQAQYAVNHLK